MTAIPTPPAKKPSPDGHHPPGDTPHRLPQPPQDLQDAVVAVDGLLSDLIDAVSKDGKLPSDVAKAFQEALQAVHRGGRMLAEVFGKMGSTDRASRPEAGVATMEQGASSAVPLTHQAAGRFSPA